MTQAEIESTVLDVLAAILRRPFPAGTDYVRGETAGWDSLKHVEVVFAVEDELGITFPEDSLPELDRVSRFVAHAMPLVAGSGR